MGGATKVVDEKGGPTGEAEEVGDDESFFGIPSTSEVEDSLGGGMENDNEDEEEDDEGDGGDVLVEIGHDGV